MDYREKLEVIERIFSENIKHIHGHDVCNVKARTHAPTATRKFTQWDVALVLHSTSYVDNLPGVEELVGFINSELKTEFTLFEKWCMEDEGRLTEIRYILKP